MSKTGELLKRIRSKMKPYRVTVTRVYEFMDYSDEDAAVTALDHERCRQFEVGEAQVLVEDGAGPTVGARHD
jgi:hypothetical protein